MKVYDGSAWNIAAISSASPTFTGTVTADGLSLGDNEKATFGAGNDLEIYHDGSNSFIRDGGTGNLVIRGTNLNLQKDGGESYITMVADGAVTAFYDNAAKLATTSTGIDVTGTVEAHKVEIGDGSAGGTSEILFSDNVSGRGKILYDHSSNPETMLLQTTGATAISIDNAQNVSIPNGIDVTGTATMDGLTVDGDAVINLSSTTGTTLGQKGGLELFANSGTVGNGGEITWQSGTGSTETWAAISGYLTSNGASGSSGHIVIGTKKLTTDTGLSERIRIASSGDISFYEDTGTTPKFFWDASAESLGIGTSSPSKPLHIYDATINNLLRIESGDSKARIEFADSDTTVVPNLGVSGNDVAIETGGLERLRIASSGNVGIGTSSPQAKLDVSGVGNFSTDWNNFSGDGLHIQCSGTGGEGAYTGGISFSRISTDNNSRAAGIAGVEGTDADRVGLAFFIHQSATTSNSLLEAMRIDYSGNVGIGTTSPSAVIHANGSSQGDVYFRGETGATKGLLFSTFNVNATDHAGHNINAVSSVGEISFSTGSTERLRIDSSGNVGIGTSSPATNLQIESSTGGNAYLSVKRNNATSTDLRIAAENGSTAIVSVGAVPMVFYTNSVERMRIDASGNLLVGTTDSNVAGNSGAANAGINIQTGGIKGVISAAAAQVVTYLNRLGTDGDIAVFRKDGTTVGSIGAVGGAPYYAGTSKALRIGTAGFYPATNTGAYSDGTVDLGFASGRFKDLYLSSTANVGSVNIDQNNAFTNTNITSANNNTDKGNFLRFMQVASGSIPAPDFSIGHGGDNTGDAVLLNASSSSMKFYTNNTEKVRITANGELLVGTTTGTGTTGTYSGFGAYAGGNIFSSSVGRSIFARRSTDGDIIEFRKDGTAVGSIGVCIAETTLI